MMTLEAIFKSTTQQLLSVFDIDESKSITYELIEHHFKVSRSNYLISKDLIYTDINVSPFNSDLQEILNHKPLQYTIGKAWFLDHEYYVNEAVLIPRPETEELVVWALEFAGDKPVKQVLEIGTGSGCIATELALGINSAKVITVDISQAAIAVAEKNIDTYQANVQPFPGNFLEEDIRRRLENKYDIIISNPPYIPQTEERDMSKHVKDWEPGLALFVPDNDPLLFYKSIAHFALENLAAEGAVFLECHYKYAIDTEKYYQSLGYKTILRKDISGNDRMLKAWL